MTVKTFDGSTHPETIVLHSGFRFDEVTHATAVPIYQTSSFQFGDALEAKQLFGLEKQGNIYSRMMNPTNDVLEKRMAALEGGVAALCVSSGQSASALAIQNLATTGDNIVSSTNLYGGTWNLFSNTLKSQGIEVRFADPTDPESFRAQTDDRTRAYYGEILPNPKLEPFPIKAVSDIGRSMGIPLITDNTVAPIICKPFEHGAAIVVHSLTKYIGGHGTTIGGMIIEGGNFDWKAYPERLPTLNQPDPSYHDTVWVDIPNELAKMAFILRARVTLLRDLGQCLSPFNAFLILQGLETLPLRMERHCQNATAVAAHLMQHPHVHDVTHPSLLKGSKAVLRDQNFKGGYGGLVGLHLKGGDESATRFINSLKMFYHLANIGDTRSLAIHPSSTTQSQLSEDEKEKSGVGGNYIRLSIGIEHIDDILADLDQALQK